MPDDRIPTERTERSVCIVGNLNVDLIIRNVPTLPVWGQEVNGTSHTLVSSGQAGYLAFALRRLEIPVLLIGTVGDDPFGHQIINDLQAFGADTSGVNLISNTETGITVGIVRPDGERAFVSNVGSSRDFTSQMAFQHWYLTRPGKVVCLVGTFFMTNMSPGDWVPMFSKAQHEGKLTMLDTGWDPSGWPEPVRISIRSLLKHTSLFMPNLDEARAITGNETPAAAAETLLKFGPQIVVVKCGSEGSYAATQSESVFVPPLKTKVFDAVGAGDAFNAGFLYGLGLNWPLKACLAFGNTVSSLYISRPSNRFPAIREVADAARSAYPFIPNISITIE